MSKEKWLRYIHRTVWVMVGMFFAGHSDVHFALVFIVMLIIGTAEDMFVYYLSAQEKAKRQEEVTP